MDCQCVVVYTVISPSTTIAPSLRVQLERALSRSSTPGCISWIKYSVKRLISYHIIRNITGIYSPYKYMSPYNDIRHVYVICLRHRAWYYKLQ